jgi:hypothetical protein
VLHVARRHVVVTRDIIYSIILKGADVTGDTYISVSESGVHIIHAYSQPYSVFITYRQILHVVYRIIAGVVIYIYNFRRYQ